LEGVADKDSGSGKNRNIIILTAPTPARLHSSVVVLKNVNKKVRREK
jgi:hypothetical protein